MIGWSIKTDWKQAPFGHPVEYSRKERSAGCQLAFNSLAQQFIIHRDEDAAGDGKSDEEDDHDRRYVVRGKHDARRLGLRPLVGIARDVKGLRIRAKVEQNAGFLI